MKLSRDFVVVVVNKLQDSLVSYFAARQFTLALHITLYQSTNELFASDVSQIKRLSGSKIWWRKNPKFSGQLNGYWFFLGKHLYMWLKTFFQLTLSATVQCWLPVQRFLRPSPKSDTADRHLQKVIDWLCISDSYSPNTKIPNYPFKSLRCSFLDTPRWLLLNFTMCSSDISMEKHPLHWYWKSVTVRDIQSFDFVIRQ